MEPTHSDQDKTEQVFKGFHVLLLVDWLEYYNNIFNSLFYSLFLRVFFILIASERLPLIAFDALSGAH
ncbi:hypothetical protein EC511_03735 [Helicobacter pylori]|nr:hypothetical protein EC511_03735 [Helicobacter pylori]